MDTSKDVCTYYTLFTWEDNYGSTIIKTILREIIRNCLNFIKEEKILQTNYWNMVERRDRIFVVRTPKCHPKISCEGVKYSFGCENNYYIGLLFDKKKGEITFKNTFQEAISRDNLTIKQFCMISRLAWGYIISYKLMSHR